MSLSTPGVSRTPFGNLAVALAQPLSTPAKALSTSTTPTPPNTANETSLFSLGGISIAALGALGLGNIIGNFTVLKDRVQSNVLKWALVVLAPIGMAAIEGVRRHGVSLISEVQATEINNEKVGKEVIGKVVENFERRYLNFAQVYDTAEFSKKTPWQKLGYVLLALKNFQNDNYALLLNVLGLKCVRMIQSGGSEKLVLSTLSHLDEKGSTSTVEVNGNTFGVNIEIARDIVTPDELLNSPINIEVFQVKNNHEETIYRSNSTIGVLAKGKLDFLLSKGDEGDAAEDPQESPPTIRFRSA